jgi:hypothetical protein
VLILKINFKIKKFNIFSNKKYFEKLPDYVEISKTQRGRRDFDTAGIIYVTIMPKMLDYTSKEYLLLVVFHSHSLQFGPPQEY